MRLLYVLIIVFDSCVVCLVTGNDDHDLFLKEATFHELGIQIRQMHEKLYANCRQVFHTLDSAMVPIIGRRRSVDTTLDLKIELAEKTLEDLILEYQKCTSMIPNTTLRTATEMVTQTTLTETTIHPTSAKLTTMKPLYTTIHQRKLCQLYGCYKQVDSYIKQTIREPN